MNAGVLEASNCHAGLVEEGERMTFFSLLYGVVEDFFFVLLLVSCYYPDYGPTVNASDSLAGLY
jgi:hypothetical protein